MHNPEIDERLQDIQLILLLFVFFFSYILYFRYFHVLFYPLSVHTFLCLHSELLFLLIYQVFYIGAHGKIILYFYIFYNDFLNHPIFNLYFLPILYFDSKFNQIYFLFLKDKVIFILFQNYLQIFSSSPVFIVVIIPYKNNCGRNFP